MHTIKTKAYGRRWHTGREPRTASNSNKRRSAPNITLSCFGSILGVKSASVKITTHTKRRRCRRGICVSILGQASEILMARQQQTHLFSFSPAAAEQRREDGVIDSMALNWLLPLSVGRGGSAHLKHTRAHYTKYSQGSRLHEVAKRNSPRPTVWLLLVSSRADGRTAAPDTRLASAGNWLHPALRRASERID